MNAAHVIVGASLLGKAERETIYVQCPVSG
jgi:hypothetical protein